VKNYSKGKKTVAVFWLVSYLFLLIIPIFANVYILMSVNNAVKQEIDLKHSYFLKSMGANIDLNLKDINSLAYAVRECESVKNMSQKTDINPSRLLELKQTAVDVSKIRAGYNNSLEIFVYFPLLDRIIFRQSYSSSAEFFTNHYKSTALGTDEQMEFLKSYDFCASKDITVDEFGKETAVYKFLYPAGRSGGGAVICVSMAEEMLFGKEIDLEKNDIVILSRGDKIYISSNDKINENDLSDLKNINETDVIYENQGGTEAGVSYIKSEIFDSYKYVFIDRSKSIHATSKKIIYIGVFVSVLSILLMMVVLYRLYGWNYLNIKDIMSILNDGAEEEKDSENEFEIIKSRIASTKTKQRAMEREIHSRLKTLKEEFIVEMLTGTTKDKDYISEGLKKYDIRFEGNIFCVSVLKVKELGVLEDTGIKSAHYVVRNIMDDVLKNESFCACEYNGLLFYIFSFKNRDGAAEHLSDVLTESCEVTKMATEIVFGSATSETGTGIESIPKLYESALNVLNISEFYGMEEHIFRQELQDNVMEHTPVYSANVENEIIVSIKTGDRKQFFETVDRLFNEYVLVNHEWVFMGLAYSILNSILKLIDMSDSGKTDEAFEMLNSFKDYDNIEKIKVFIKDYGVHAMEIFNSEKEEKTELYERAIDYINNHYTESDLNVAKVSESLGVTSIYLAFIVKQNSGVKLSEYIAKLRVDKAKNLLDGDAEMRVEEVARLSGFWQNRTFYNTFKKHTGLTPTQYRMLSLRRNEPKN